MPRTNSSENFGERGTDKGADAIALLKADHAAVHKLFTAYNKLCAAKDGDEGEKGELAARICNELTVHVTIEEEIFYPALREALDDQATLDMQALGDEMRSCQQELKAEAGLAGEDADGKPAKGSRKGGHAPNGNRRAA